MGSSLGVGSDLGLAPRRRGIGGDHADSQRYKSLVASSREPSTDPMIATRSLIFNALFYLNLVVLMIVGLPTMLFGRRSRVRARPAVGRDFRLASGKDLRSAASNIAGSRTFPPAPS